jgi:DNA-binding HxlR family transcriptional regulator
MAHRPDPEAAWQTADLLTRRWVLHVLAVLAREPTRHNDLRRAINDLRRPASAGARQADGERVVHDNVLARILRQMEVDGFVERTVLDQHPPGVQYALTAKGRSLLPIVEVLANWYRDHGSELAARRSTHGPPAD